MEANKTKCFRLYQRPVIKFLVVDKYKPCEIYWRMCDVYGDEIFFGTNAYKLVKMSLPLQVGVKKLQKEVET